MSFFFRTALIGRGNACRCAATPTRPITTQRTDHVMYADGDTSKATLTHAKLDFISVVQAWSPRSKCTVPGCTSKAIFYSRDAFYTHVKNMHTDPLLCSVEGCTYRKPFGRQSDLKRHKESVHSEQRKFICPVQSCDIKYKDFSRKDHLLKHMREMHPDMFCALKHCPSDKNFYVGSLEGMNKHIADAHGPYECGIKSCVGTESKFREESFHDHLQDHMDYRNIFFLNHNSFMEVLLRIDGRLSKMVKEADLGPYNFDSGLRDCYHCERRHTTINEQD